MATGINIKFPFKETQVGGVFDSNHTTENALKDDLISLLTTRRGQRPMRSTLYSPIYDYIMEQMDDFTKKNLESDIEQKVSEFIPQITITRIEILENIGKERHMGKLEESQNSLSIQIFFKIDTSFGVQDSIIINLPREQHSENGESPL